MSNIPAFTDLMTSLLDSFTHDGPVVGNADLIEPYDASAGVRVDPATAWSEVQTVAKLCGLSVKASPTNDWASVAFQDNSQVALPCALGFYPQQVSDIPKLLQAMQTGKFDPKTPIATIPTKNKIGSDPLLSAGTARMVGQYDRADDLQKTATGCAAWVIANETASTLWVRGNHEAALAVWTGLPANPVVCLNRGMANLFLGNRTEAAVELKVAIAGLPANSGWNHLAELYLSLAGM